MVLVVLGAAEALADRGDLARLEPAEAGIELLDLEVATLERDRPDAPMFLLTSEKNVSSPS